MLLIVLFWVALVVAVVSWIGAVADGDHPEFGIIAMVLFIVALFAAWIQAAAWL